MRAAWLALFLAALAGDALAQSQGGVRLNRLCADDGPRGARLISVPRAEAELMCRASAQGELQTCYVTRAEPDNPTVRYFALQQLCFNPRRDPSSLAPDGAGVLWGEFTFRFSVECTRTDGMQMCNAGPPRAGADSVAEPAAAMAEEQDPRRPRPGRP